MENSHYRELSESEYNDLLDRILYEDNHLIIFNKRSGEITQGDKTGDEPLSEALKAFIAKRDSKPGKVFLGVVHRIDRPVSGAVIFAKTSKGLSKMNELLRNGKLAKKYLTLVCNKPPKEEEELRHLLFRNEKNNKTYITECSTKLSDSQAISQSHLQHNSQKKSQKEYKEGFLKYRYLGATTNYYLLEIELYTGRHHQIRAQLSHIGSPIKGDLKYGAPRSNKDGSISLHSHTVSFIHPVKNKKVSITAPILSNIAFPQIKGEK